MIQIYQQKREIKSKKGVQTEMKSMIKKVVLNWMKNTIQTKNQ